MASPSELSLDCNPHHSYSVLLKSFGDHQFDQTQTYNLEEFVSRLEEERIKIDAFKRELPLCMQLLTNAMEASRQQLEAFRGNQGTKAAVLEEFIPLKHSTSESSEKASSTSDKANWMISAQLWSQASEETKPQSTITSPKEAEIGFNVSHKLALDTKQRKGGGAFLPFSKERSSNQGSSLQALPELALASADKQMEDKKYPEPENSRKGGNGEVVADQGKGTTVSSEAKTTSKTASNATTTTTTQTHRKARRCWSPDLHRRFVNALQMLGGSQATPKQIRELMKVDGLTNDEVKSHLQKYRLHTRRPSPNPQVAGAAAPQLVVLGGIWVPPAGAANALFSSHPASQAPPPHYCTTPVPQDLYTAASPQQHNHGLLHHHHLHGYRTTSHTQRSPESESIEDGKSESSSWKQGESGENEGERKGLGALREDGEESKGSAITLKF